MNSTGDRIYWINYITILGGWGWGSGCISERVHTLYIGHTIKPIILWY